MAKQIIDLSGQRFGFLTVIGLAISSSRNKKWRCHCDCGKEIIAIGGNLKRGATRSCGHLRSGGNSVSHGMSRDPAYRHMYRRWEKIRQRCFNKNHRHYKSYGGRGITLCERWNNFELFMKDVGFPPSSDHSLDRIDTNGNYDPSNVRWATHKEQCNNMRKNNLILFRGEVLTISQLADKFQISQWVLGARVRKGWDIERAVTAPVRPRRKRGELK